MGTSVAGVIESFPLDVLLRGELLHRLVVETPSSRSRIFDEGADLSRGRRRLTANLRRLTASPARGSLVANDPRCSPE